VIEHEAVIAKMKQELEILLANNSELQTVKSQRELREKGVLFIA
jgi:hypothetical protein